jgi:transposase
MSNLDTCGIEVSAQELVVRLRRQAELEPLRNFTNTPAGHAILLRHLRRAGRVVRVCLEASGLYGLDLALALSAQEGLEVMVANPRAVRHFATALMQRSKNDQIDAGVLEEFAARMPFQPWTRPAPAALALHALARRLGELVQMQTAEKNRQPAAELSQAMPAAIRRDLARSLRAQERAIKRLTREARRVIAQEAELTERFALLDSVPGIAETSAVQLLAELAVLAPDLEARQWVAYAGLDPREYSSGTSVHKKVRISKAGNKHLRHALYMPALVAVQHDPHLRAFYQRLLQRGKLKMPALVAVMRKLLHAFQGMFKTHQPYDGAKLVQLKPTSAQEASLATLAS